MQKKPNNPPKASIKRNTFFDEEIFGSAYDSKIVKRLHDKNGQYLYKDYKFLEDFKGTNTLLFVMNNVTVSFSLK